jgi:hypothetical protein
LKTHIEEAKRTEEVMMIQMMKEEEEVEKIEEEVVTLRFKIVKLSKNVEERETFASLVENVEEKHSRFPEKKNEEKGKSYAELLKRKNHGQAKWKKNYRETYSIRPPMFKQQGSFNFDEGNSRREDRDKMRHEFRRTAQQRISFTPMYEIFFYGQCFNCTNYGYKVVDCRAYGRSVQERNAYVAPHKIECYK